jgi:hypothetical protein
LLPVVRSQIVLIRQDVRHAARPSEDLRHLTSSEVLRSGQKPDHQELERFVRHLSMPPESDGITSNTSGRSSATTISHIEPSGSAPANCASENFGSPPVRVTANERLRTRESVSGRSPGLSGVHQNAFGCSPGNHTTRACGALVGLTRPRRTTCSVRMTSVVQDDFGLPTVRDDSHQSVPGHSPELRLHRISPRFDASYPKFPLCGDRVVTKTISSVGSFIEQCTFSGATVVNLTSTPGFGLSQGNN